MRNWLSARIESADFAFEMYLCIVISRAQGRPETGSAETQKFFLEKYITIPVRTTRWSLLPDVRERMLKCT